MGKKTVLDVPCDQLRWMANIISKIFWSLMKRLDGSDWISQRACLCQLVTSEALKYSWYSWIFERKWLVWHTLISDFHSRASATEYIRIWNVKSLILTTKNLSFFKPKEKWRWETVWACLWSRVSRWKLALFCGEEGKERRRGNPKPSGPGIMELTCKNMCVCGSICYVCIYLYTHVVYIYNAFKLAMCNRRSTTTAATSTTYEPNNAAAASAVAGFAFVNNRGFKI